MNPADSLALILVVLCLVGSVFFSASETAITSFGDLRAHRIKEEGGFEGRTVSAWVDRPLFVLSTILFGNNVVNTLMATVIAGLVARHLAGGSWSAYAVPLAAAGSTLLLLLFGEIIPKALGKMYARTVTIPVLWILNLLGQLTYPVIWCLEKLSMWIVGGVRNRSATAPRVTAHEIGYLVKVGARDGSLRADQAAMLQGVFRFDDKIVRDIMVPLDRISAVDLRWEINRIKSVAKRTGHSRLPVYVDDMDNVRGVLHIKELVHGETEGADPRYIEKILRPALFVSESLRIYDLLRQLKDRRVHLAIVVDDAGDTVGAVTLEDVLEQIVGDIFDESDRDPAYRPTDRHGVHYMGGQESLSRVEELCALEFSSVDGVDSVGDLLTQLAGQIPTTGSIFVWEQVRFKVLSANPKRIIRVSVERVERSSDEDD